MGFAVISVQSRDAIVSLRDLNAFSSGVPKSCLLARASRIVVVAHTNAVTPLNFPCLVHPQPAHKAGALVVVSTRELRGEPSAADRVHRQSRLAPVPPERDEGSRVRDAPS
jgi:hypothetical protein